MASVVSCPGCHKRMKIGADKPGGKLRCPSCHTPFVLGNPTGLAFGGTPEVQAFELFQSSKATLPPRSPDSLSKPAADVESSKTTLPPRHGFGGALSSFGATNPDGMIIDPSDRSPNMPQTTEEPNPAIEVDEAVDDDFFLPKDFDPFAVRKTASATIINTVANVPFLKMVPKERASQEFEVILSPVQPIIPETSVVPAATDDDAAPVVVEAQRFEIIDDERRARRRESKSRRERADEEQGKMDVHRRRRVNVWGIHVPLGWFIASMVAAATLVLLFVFGLIAAILWL